MKIKEAVQIITEGRNLFKVPNTAYCREAYFCKNHNKFHKYTFHQSVVFTTARMFGFDTKEELFAEANRILAERSN